MRAIKFKVEFNGVERERNALRFVVICVFLIIFSFGFNFSLRGQDQGISEKGTVSYITSTNVYVKFESTDKIEVGDTLFIRKDGEWIPALSVGNKSSISCVCTPLISSAIKVGDEFFTRKIIAKEEETEFTVEEKQEVTPIEEQKDLEEESSPLDKEEDLLKQKIKGRISAASYSSFSESGEKHRMRYSFSFRGNNLGGSKISLENYITFRHSLNEWQEVKENLAKALKVYALAFKYDFNKSTSLMLGRKINPKMSGMGAIDGIQFQKGIGKFALGAIVGARPDHFDYSINLDLLQAGAYISHESNNNNKYQQSTLAFIEQRNKGKIDRRFVHFQHSNALVKNLNLFYSFDLDLYKNIQEVASNTLSLTNLYFSLRYRFSRKLSFSASYDNRKNIIYYETYKSYIDRLIENETRQGLRFHVNYRPFKYISWGVNANWRFQKSNKNSSKNLNSYVSISRIPGLNISATIRVNFLETNYLKSKIYGVRMSKDIIPGKLSSYLYFRLVDYQYKLYENAIQHKIAGINFSLNWSKSSPLICIMKELLMTKIKSTIESILKSFNDFKK